LIIIFHTFIAIVVGKQAKRQTISCAVLYYTITAFCVIFTGYFGAGTFFFVATGHFFILNYILLFFSLFSLSPPSLVSTGMTVDGEVTPFL
jgi:hypothetical protein